MLLYVKNQHLGFNLPAYTMKNHLWMGYFDTKIFHQIQRVPWLAMPTLPEAPIWVQPHHLWVLLPTPEKPVRGGSGDKAALGKIEKPLGFQMGHSR